jgi:hypothetical protein
MNLTPEQIQILQYYMQKNRNIVPGQQAAPIQLPQQQSGGGGNLLKAFGALGDTRGEQQGPLPMGMNQNMQRPMATNPSVLSQFAGGDISGAIKRLGMFF